MTQETESVRSRLGDQPGGVTCKATGPEKTDVPARGSWGWERAPVPIRRLGKLCINTVSVAEAAETGFRTDVRVKRSARLRA